MNKPRKNIKPAGSLAAKKIATPVTVVKKQRPVKASSAKPLRSGSTTKSTGVKVTRAVPAATPKKRAPKILVRGTKKTISGKVAGVKKENVPPVVKINTPELPKAIKPDIEKKKAVNKSAKKKVEKTEKKAKKLKKEIKKTKKEKGQKKKLKSIRKEFAKILKKLKLNRRKLKKDKKY